MKFRILAEKYKQARIPFANEMGSHIFRSACPKEMKVKIKLNEELSNLNYHLKFDINKDTKMKDVHYFPLLFVDICTKLILLQ